MSNELFILCTQRGVPQGDLRIAVKDGKRRLYHSEAKRLKPYREALAWEAKAAVRGRGVQPFKSWEHVKVYARFFFEDSLARGDGDKLMRAVLDALTGIVYADDKQVSEGGWKIEPVGREYAVECVEIRVSAAQETQAGRERGVDES